APSPKGATKLRYINKVTHQSLPQTSLAGRSREEEGVQFESDFRYRQAIDLCVVPTLTFERLFAFLVVGHGRRQLLWFAVTRNPSAEWLAQQMAEAFPWNTAPTYLVRDNDRAYGQAFQRRIRAMGIRDRPISPRSPWQNPYAERLIGTLRRECLDHVLIVGERHLRRMLASYSSYYNDESYCLSFYVIDSKRLDCQYFGPVGCDRRLRTRSTTYLASSQSRIARLKSQGPSASGWVAS